MKVIITGGTGLIGSALAHSLVGDGHEVVVLTRDASKPVKSLPSAARLVKWDAKTGEGWYQEAEGADAIVNLAGANISPTSGLWTESRKKVMRESRVNAGNAVVDAIKRTTRKPKALIQSSAVGYYGVHDDEIITETSPTGSDFLASICRDWEASTAEVEAMGVRRVLLRTGVVFDKNSGALPVLALPIRLFAGGPVGSGRQYLSWIHIDDEVEAIRLVISDESATGPYNLTAPNPVTQKEFAKVAGKVLNRPSFIPTPAFAIKLVLGEAATFALDGQRVIPKALQDKRFEFRFPNLEGALRDLLK
jgi:uncharacterized protein (TIGR01777 family)